MIFDGRLNYRTENIPEACYAWTILKGLVTTFDEFINNPAYNADLLRMRARGAVIKRSSV